VVDVSFFDWEHFAAPWRIEYLPALASNKKAPCDEVAGGVI
jgi:hypothetical protein